MTESGNHKKSGLSGDKVVDVLLKEHEITCSQIREMVSYSDRIFGLGITLVGALFLYGFKEHLEKVMIAVSFVFIALLLFSTTIYTGIFSLGGYRLYIEEQLNQLMGRQLLSWERMTPKILHSSFPVFGMTTFTGILLFVVVASSWQTASDAFQPDTVSLITSGYAIGGLLLLGSFLKLLRARREAYRLAIAATGSVQTSWNRKRILRFPVIRQICIFVSQRRGEDVAAQLENLLDRKSTIIDVGCGTGGVTHALRKRGFDATATDIGDLVMFSEVPFVIADGAKLPFKDWAFGTCVLHTTLHHAELPRQVLLEAKRVGQRVIVGEEIVEDVWDRFVMSCYDSLVNLSFRGHPHNNRSDEGWKALFDSVGLRVIDVRRNRVFGFIRQAVYFLE